jgi:outer membrane protein TolC
MRIRIGSLMACWALVGCHVKRPDISADVAQATGLEHAITFRETAEALSGAGAAGGTLSVYQTVRLALAHDPRIQSAMARVRVAEADANQSRLLPNPVLTIDTRFPTNPGSNTAFEASLSGDVVALLQKPALVSAADKRLRESACDALTAVLDVIAEAQTAYVSSIALDAQIGNAKDRQQILQHLRDIGQKRLDAGDATRLDVTTLDAQLMQSSLDLSDLQLQRTEQRLILGRMIGQPLGACEWTLTSWEDKTAGGAGESAWIDAALLHRPEINSRVWELRALGDDLSATALAPLLGGELGAHSERDPEWRVGPVWTIPLPLFDWGQASRAKVKAQRIAARHDLAQQQLQVIQEVRLAYATYQQSTQTLNAAQRTLLPLLRQQLDQSQRAYQAGEIDLATLLLAETDFEVALSRIVSLRQSTALAEIKLQRAAGGAAIAQGLAASASRPGAAAATATSQPRTGAAP